MVVNIYRNLTGDWEEVAVWSPYERDYSHYGLGMAPTNPEPAVQPPVPRVGECVKMGENLLLRVWQVVYEDGQKVSVYLEERT